MSISIFTLPKYKSFKHASDEVYLNGKTDCSCKDGELEEFLPIWQKLTSGKFAGADMNLKGRILDEEYSMYPIVFITSDCWPRIQGGTCSTTVHVVQKQDQNIASCKSFDHRYIDRDVGVIILEKTVFHDGATEPGFSKWFYEKDTREDLPKGILAGNFTKENNGGIFVWIKKAFKAPLFKEKSALDQWDQQYEEEAGYLTGNAVTNFVNAHSSTESLSKSISLIQWQNCWNFVVGDNYGQQMFRVNNETVEAFFEQNNLFGKAADNADTIYSLGYDAVRRKGKLLLQKLSKDGTKRAEIWYCNGEQSFILFDLKSGQNLSYEQVAVKRGKYPNWSIWKDLEKVEKAND